MSDKIFETIEPEVDHFCSFCVCSNLHKWRVQLAIAKCKGCGSEVIARRLNNCPVCNEPADRVEIRIDNLATGMSVMPMCKGAERVSQVDVVVLERQVEEFEKGTNETRQSNS